MNPYEILELSPNCTLEDLKKAYRKKALIYHPDVSNDNNKFIEINKAYQVILKSLLTEKPPKSIPKPKPQKPIDRMHIVDFEPKYDLWGNPIDNKPINKPSSPKSKPQEFDQDSFEKYFNFKYEQLKKQCKTKEELFQKLEELFLN